MDDNNVVRFDRPGSSNGDPAPATPQTEPQSQPSSQMDREPPSEQFAPQGPSSPQYSQERPPQPQQQDSQAQYFSPAQPRAQQSSEPRSQPFSQSFSQSQPRVQQFSQTEPQVISRPRIPVERMSGPKLLVGRGLDVGTANVLSAVQTEEGDVQVRRERNAFIEIPASSGGGKETLTRLKVPFVTHKDKLYVLGDVSFELANMFGKEVRRPMQDGFLAPGEQDAVPIMKFLLERLLGRPQVENEPVHFCIPAPSIDQDNDTVYHEGVVGGILRKLGFAPTSMNEGHAVVYSELAETGFTGIGVSCGGGMFNVCISYKTIPALTFSVARGGDWIDSHVAKVMGIQRVRATAIKEGGIDLAAPRSREEEAVVLYYRNLISYVLRNLKQRFQLARDVPQFTDPVEIVCAGGTSLVTGFVQVFAEEIRRADLPFPVACVRRADDPMTSVVRGTLIAASLEGN